MSANRYTNYTPQEYHSLFQPVNFQEILQLGLLKEKQYEEGQEQISDFEKMLNVPALDPDNIKKKERIKYYEDQLNSALDQNKGDYSKMIPKVKSLKKELFKEFRDGELGAISNNYSQDSEYKKRLNDLVDKKLIDVSTADQLYNVNRSQYKGIGIQNSLGRFNSYNTISPAEQVNVSEELDKMAKDWKADAVASGGFRWSKDGKYIIKTDGSNEAVSAKEIFDNITASAKNNPKIMNFLKQQTMLDTYGKGQEQAEGYTIGNNSYKDKQSFDNLYTNELLNTPAMMVANKYGYSKTMSKSDISADSYSLKDYENENTRDLFRYALPASTTEKSNVPNKVLINADGSVSGQGNPSMVISAIDNAVENGKSVINGIFGALQMNPLMPGFDPGEGTKKLAKAKYYSAAAKVPSADKQQIINKSANDLREQFPSLKEMFPENKQKNSKGEYDANAAKLINFVHDAMMQNQTIINHIDIPSDPVKATAKTQLFNTNTFGKLNYKLPGGSLETKDEANKVIGKVTKEKLDKAEFNGFGGFINPGAIYAQVPNDDDEMVDIVIEPDETTKNEIYLHSTDAAKVYKTGKPITKVKVINDGKERKQYVFEYFPQIDKDGMKVNINQWEYSSTTEDGKGKPINVNPETGVQEPDNAFDVYSQEYALWLQMNKYNLK